MNRIHRSIRASLLAVIAVQLGAIMPGLETERAIRHLSTEHGGGEHDCCEQHAAALQAPCDPGGPCNNPHHQHHPHGRPRRDALPCPICLRLGGVLALLVDPVTAAIHRTVERLLPSDEASDRHSIEHRRPGIRAPPTPPSA